MTDIMSKKMRSALMSKIHQPTMLEGEVHGFLCAIHAKHRMYPKIEGNPDIALFAPRGTAYLFIDGCWWHMCPLHYRRPKSNVKFWVHHIEDSNLRREIKRLALPYAWQRIWEHEVRNGSFKATLRRMLARRSGGHARRDSAASPRSATHTPLRREARRGRGGEKFISLAKPMK